MCIRDSVYACGLRIYVLGLILPKWGTVKKLKIMRQLNSFWWHIVPTGVEQWQLRSYIPTKPETEGVLRKKFNWSGTKVKSYIFKAFGIRISFEDLNVVGIFQMKSFHGRSLFHGFPSRHDVNENTKISFISRPTYEYPPLLSYIIFSFQFKFSNTD